MYGSQQLKHRHLARVWAPAVFFGCVGFARPAAATEDSWWGCDKSLHFFASAAIAGGTYALGATQWDSRLPAAGLALGVTITVGASKEAWDAADHGDASWKDFAWDVVGAIAGIGLSSLIDTAVRPESR